MKNADCIERLSLTKGIGKITSDPNSICTLPPIGSGRLYADWLLQLSVEPEQGVSCGPKLLDSKPRTEPKPPP